MGMMPWGSLLLGWIALRAGTANVVMIGGGLCIFAGLTTWLDRRSHSRADRRFS